MPRLLRTSNDNKIEPIWDIDRETGELIRGWERCRQSIYVILSTRIRMRLMRLWWGSDFQHMQDQPGNMQTMAASIMSAAMSINEYEPEFIVSDIIIDEFGPDGTIVITVVGDYLPDLQQRKVNFFI